MGPTPGSEEFSGLKDINYKKFHEDVSSALAQANYPFIYYCRVTAPSAIAKVIGHENGLNYMSKKLMPYFFAKGFYFDLKPLKVSKNTANEHFEFELLISNRNYSPETQFQWEEFDTLLNESIALVP